MSTFDKHDDTLNPCNCLLYEVLHLGNEAHLQLNTQISHNYKIILCVFWYGNILDTARQFDNSSALDAAPYWGDERFRRAGRGHGCALGQQRCGWRCWGADAGFGGHRSGGGVRGVRRSGEARRRWRAWACALQRDWTSTDATPSQGRGAASRGDAAQVRRRAR